MKEDIFIKPALFRPNLQDERIQRQNTDNYSVITWCLASIKPKIFVSIGMRDDMYIDICNEMYQDKTRHIRCFSFHDTISRQAIHEDIIQAHLKHDRKFREFSQILHCNLIDAANQFEDNTIDLLFLSGIEDYATLSSSFDVWLTKMSESGVILFEVKNGIDTSIERLRFWHKISCVFQNVYFEKLEIGILSTGNNPPSEIQEIFAYEPQRQASIQNYFIKLASARSFEQKMFGNQSISTTQIVQHQPNQNQLQYDLFSNTQSAFVIRIILFFVRFVKVLLHKGRRLYRSVRRRKVHLRFVPSSQDAQIFDKQKHVWEAKGNDPQFAITPCKALSRGWVHLHIAISITEMDLVRSRLYLNTGEGYREDQSIVLAYNRAGFIDTPIHLPDNLLSIRFDPFDRTGLFQLSSMWMQEVSYFEAFFQFLRAYYRGNRFFDTTKHLYTTYRKKGLQALRKMVIDKSRPHIIGANEANYPDWIAINEILTESEREKIQEHIQVLSDETVFTCIIVAYGKNMDTVESIRSLLKQMYPNWLVYVLGNRKHIHAIDQILQQQGINDQRIRYVQSNDITLQDLLNQIHSDTSNSHHFTLFLKHCERLSETALYFFAAEIEKHPNTTLIYADEDHIDQNAARQNPNFKPDWNYDLCISNNYIGGSVAFEFGQLSNVMSSKIHEFDTFDILLQCIERNEQSTIRHIPHILFHIPISQEIRNSKQHMEITGYHMKSLHQHFQRQGIHATVMLNIHGSYRIKYMLPKKLPLVSIIIPTYNGYTILKRCVDSIQKRTLYPNYEILIINNNVNDKDTLDYLRELDNQEVKILMYPEKFNYSAINNFAVTYANGEILCLLNNDTEVISPDWLDEMVGHAARRTVGAVGAMLYYPNDTIQHAGVILGMGGIAEHAHKYLNRNAPGYQNRATVVQSIMAVTGACLVVRKKLYLDVGGLNENDLSVAYNDVDFCLKLVARGLRNIWTPFAELYHHESISRGIDDSPEKIARFMSEMEYMTSQWGDFIKDDPAYNPNLSLESNDFTLSWKTRKLFQRKLADEIAVIKKKSLSVPLFKRK